MQPYTDSGTPLLAEFAVEAHGERLSLIFNSAGGKGKAKARPRNADYRPALVVLLGRLAQRSAVITSAAVESRQTEGLSLSERSLTDGPIKLAPDTDVEALRKSLTRAQGPIGQRAGARKDGNRSKRMRLVLEVPGYAVADGPRLERELAAQIVVGDLMDSLRLLKVHNAGGGPIALLWALGRLAAGRGRLFDWSEFRDEVGELLGDLGATATPQDPFWDLGSDPALWETHGLAGPPVESDTDARGGFTKAAADLLATPMVLAEAVFVLCDVHLSDVPDHPALLRRVGLDGQSERAMSELRTVFDSVDDVTIRALSAETLDKMTAVFRRVEQAELRKLVVGNVGTASCALCGYVFPLRYLVAAHIKPRSKCTDEERRDLRNVAMAACAFGCDLLFELGYITVDVDGWIRTAEALPSGRFADHVNLVGTLRCSAHRPETEPYFAWHRANRFINATGQRM